MYASYHAVPSKVIWGMILYGVSKNAGNTNKIISSIFLHCFILWFQTCL